MVISDEIQSDCLYQRIRHENNLDHGIFVIKLKKYAP